MKQGMKKPSRSGLILEKIKNSLEEINHWNYGTRGVN